MAKLVAFTGLAGSGKSTASEYLVQRGWVCVKFAGPLKAMMRGLLDHVGVKDVHRHLEGDLKETPCKVLCGVTPRNAMQTLGTEWGRDIIGHDLWVRLAREQIESLMGSGENVVIDDCRYNNEAETIRDMGGTVVRVVNNKHVVSDHPSEHPPAGDFTLYNHHSIDMLHKNIHYVFTSIEESE